MCDDGFNEVSANIICKTMGYTDVVEWRGGQDYWYNRASYQDIILGYDINLDDVTCSEGGYWCQCEYTTDHNCRHSEDVFLSCTGKIEEICLLGCTHFI